MAKYIRERINPLGYSVNNFTWPLLNSKLCLGESAFLHLKKSLRDVSNKYLVLDTTRKAQDDAMDLMEEELKERWPELYSDEAGTQKEENLYITLRAIMKNHWYHRLQQHRQVCKVDRRISKCATSVHPQSHNTEMHGTPTLPYSESARAFSLRPRTKKISYYTPVLSHKVPRSVGSSKGSGPGPLSRLKKANPYAANRQSVMQDPAHQGVASSLPRKGFPAPLATDERSDRTATPHMFRPFPLPTLSIQNHINLDSDLEIEPPPNTSLDPIIAFLKSCQPPMDRYLHCFVEYGCTTVEYLDGIAAWSEEQRRRLIKEILNLDGGKPVSRMDVEILQVQLETFRHAKGGL